MRLVSKKFIILVRDCQLVTVWVEESLIKIDLGKTIDGFIKIKAGLETRIGGLEEHLLGCSLESVCVGPCDSSQLCILWGTVAIEHALFSSTSSCEVTKALVHPVGP